MAVVPFSSRLPEETVTKLKVYAAKNQITMQEALKRIIDEYLEKEKTK